MKFFFTGIFSTFNVVKLTNNSGVSQEPNEEQEYLQMSMAAHAAAAGGLRPDCSRRQRVLRRAAEGPAPPLPGPGERLARTRSRCPGSIWPQPPGRGREEGGEDQGAPGVTRPRYGSGRGAERPLGAMAERRAGGPVPARHKMVPSALA